MASSSSSHVDPIKYEVFISFRGEDVRRGFLSHLTKELRSEKIDYYVDERLERGEEISSALFNAIEGSMISLVIFSEDYASSTWCLEELVKIMECKKVNGQTVIPVFYHVDPSHVRKPDEEGTYKASFDEHKQKLKDNIHKLEIYKSALNKAANISGYHLSFNFENESELIDEIVKDLLKKLDCICPSESATGLVGIDQHLAHIVSILERKVSAVQIVGIWGMGGIGKTAVTRAVYDKFSLQYDHYCFLENIREESSQTCGLRVLQNQLLSELLGEKSHFHKKRLYRKKVLIVLDDVSTLKQLEYLVKEQVSLGPNSKVIVTSRDRHVLISGGAYHDIHEVKGLNFEHSLELFCLKAFNKSNPEEGYEDLSKGVVDYADGVPLALKVLGSFLHSMNKETWEIELKKLKKYPNVEIQNVLKLSYDGLDDMKKHIFLKIAFLYKGQYKDDVIDLLQLDFACREIDSLLDRALITISHNRIEMHSLIQEMGWEIVRQDSKIDPRRLILLDDNEEAYEVLQKNKNVHRSLDNFHKMTNLIFFKLHSFKHICQQLPTGSESFSNKPIHLYWNENTLESLLSSFSPKNLVELRMRCSLIERLWDGVQDLVNLRKVDLWGSRQLKELPDFSKAPKLELLELSDCRSLRHVHPSILSLQRLSFLGLWGCKSLKSFQSKTLLKSLKQLIIIGCSSLFAFSLWVKEVIDIRFSPFSINIVHSSDGHLSEPACLSFNGSTLKIRQVDKLYCLKSLKDPTLSDCRQVNETPSLNIEIGDLCSIRELYLDGFSDFHNVSESITCLSSLRVLRMKGCGIKSLPTCIKLLEMLEMLDLSDCKRLGSLPELPKSIKHLNFNNCTSLRSLGILTALLNYSVRFLSLINCEELCKSGIMEQAYRSLQPLVLESNTSASVCYPGSRVPEWFKDNRTTKATIIIELSPNSGDLKGFACCFVLRPFNSKQNCVIHLNYQCYVEDGEEVQGMNGDMATEFSSDHVFLLYDGSFCDQILRELLDRRRNDQGTTHSRKLSFEFSVIVNDETAKRDDLIKECGVCPMYVSEYHSFLQQNKLERKNREGSSRMKQI